MQTNASPEKALLSQVILTAVMDACAPPPKPVKKPKGIISHGGMMMRSEAFTAMRFLFDTTVPGLYEYSLWLDFDADQFRSRLLRLMANDSVNQLGQYASNQRRAFRINYKLWQNIQTQEAIEWSVDDAELESEQGE